MTVGNRSVRVIGQDDRIHPMTQPITDLVAPVDMDRKSRLTYRFHMIDRLLQCGANGSASRTCSWARSAVTARFCVSAGRSPPVTATV